MTARKRGDGVRPRPIGLALAVSALVLALAPASAKSPHGEDIHRSEAACGRCHTSDRDALQSDRGAARGMIASDLETRCTECHNEGPSHRTGMAPKKAVQDPLLLSDDGLITCSTCHYMHNEPNPFSDFLRIDNSRGGLCLTCHELSDLQ